MIEDPLSRSSILKEEFGKSWRAWAWFRRQFTPTSLAIIATMGGAAGGYIIHLGTRVVVLETKIIPFIQGQGEITELKVRVEEVERRLDKAEQVSHEDPKPKKYAK